nr:VanW family protein [Lysinibacillus timonensis]
MNIQIKMFTLVVLSVFLIYLLLPASEMRTAYADDEGNGSTIAGVNVEGLDREEIQNVLTNAIADWTQQDLVVAGGGIELEIDPSTLQFDIEASIDEYETLSYKPWYAFWRTDRMIQVPLKVTGTEELKSEIANVSAWDPEATYNQILSQASFLMGHQVEATVKNVDVYDNERLSLAIEEIPTNAYAPEELVHLLDDVLINPGQQFAFLDTIGESATSVNQESLNFVASLLYSAVLETEFDIIERHSQGQVPSYLELGKDANINIALNEDFKFLNNSENVVKLNVSIEGSRMKVELSSNAKEKEVLVRVDKEILSPRFIYRYSNELPIGHEQVLQDGNEGYRVIVFRTISGNGTIEEEQVSRDYYPPVNEIVLKSSKQPEPTTDGEKDGEQTDTDDIDLETDKETDSNSEVEHDSNMDIDLDGDGLPDIEIPVKNETPSTYDKGGNKVTP